jgi:hypothetical protein
MVIDRYTKKQIDNLEMEIEVEHHEFDTANWYHARQRYLGIICEDKELLKMLDEKHAGWCIDSCDMDDLSEYNKQINRAFGRPE